MAFFLHIGFLCFFFFCPWAVQAAWETWAEWDSKSEAGEVPGIWTSASEALWTCGNPTFSPEGTPLSHPHPPRKPSEGILALRGQLSSSSCGSRWAAFTGHWPLWWGDNLSLTSTRVLFSVVPREVDDRGPAVVLRSHYRQTEQK